MKIFGRKSQGGFTLVELLVVLVIIIVLMVIVLANVGKSHSFARDSQVKNDRQTIRLALARDAGFTSGGQYPGTSGTWYCLKTTGTNCYGGAATVNATLNNSSTGLLSYMPGKVYPLPPTGGIYDSYVYNPRDSVKIPNYTGPVLLWWQERSMTTADCNGTITFTSNVYLCYEKLIQ